MPTSRNRNKQRPGRNVRFEKKMEAVQRLNPFVTNYIKKLEAENEQMKTNPETAIGQLVPQLRAELSQNKRLSVLTAAIIEAQGGSIKLSKEALEVFESKVLSIHWTLPEGVEKLEDASEFVFTYTALTQEEAAAKNAEVTVTSNEAGTVVETVPSDEVSLEEFQEVVEESDENHEKLLKAFQEQQAEENESQDEETSAVTDFEEPITAELQDSDIS